MNAYEQNTFKNEPRIEWHKISVNQSSSQEINNDNVNHPKHYTSHPSGVECIQITEHMNFNLGNAIKYLWRNEGKNGIEDLRKAVWYIEREIKLRESREQVDDQ